MIRNYLPFPGAGGTELLLLSVRPKLIRLSICDSFCYFLQAMIRKYMPFAVVGGIVLLVLFFRLTWFR